MPVEKITADDFTPWNLTFSSRKRISRRKGRFAHLLENNSDCSTFRGGKGARFSAVLSGVE